MKFSEFELHPALVAGIEKLGFESCTDIQEAAIPYILAGKDLAGLAQTGTGKTAAFLLPMMDRVLKSRDIAKEFVPKDNSESTSEDAVSGDQLVKMNESVPQTEKQNQRCFDDWKKQNFILVLVPTRELADQVCRNVVELCPGGEIQSVAIFGGTSYDKQIDKIKKGVEIIVATPGRLIDLYKERVVDLNQIRGVVFDEADRMFDMGFKDDMKYILKRIPRERQFLVFSATLNFDVMNTAYEFGADPVEVNISKDQATAENVNDELFHLGNNDKPGALLSLLKQHQPRQLIIFSNFKKNVERIALFLNKNGYPALGISSLLTQGQRNRVMAQFKSDSDRNILVATDVAARGLDVVGVDMVVNYELPDDPENYVHRIGRTGRANEKGKAFSLVSDRDVEALARIEDYTRKKIETGWIEDEFLVKEHEPFPRDSELDYSKTNDGKKGGPRRDRPKGKSQRGNSSRRNSNNSNGKANKYSKKPKNNSNNQEARSDKSSNEEQKEGQSTATHRDRRTGRHKPKGQQGRNAKSNSSSRSKNKSNKRRSYKKGQNKTNNSRQPAAEASIGKKIGGFLKKLFS